MEKSMQKMKHIYAICKIETYLKKTQESAHIVKKGQSQ